MNQIILHEKWQVTNNSIMTKQIKQITKHYIDGHSLRFIAEALNHYSKPVKGYIKRFEVIIFLSNFKITYQAQYRQPKLLAITYP